MINEKATLKCVNDNGISLIMKSPKEKGVSPFLLVSADGLYDIDANVITSDNTMTDGAVYHSTNLQKRNIVLNLRDIVENQFEKNRIFLDTLFAPKKQGTLYYDEDTVHRKINYYVEKLSFSGSGAKRNYQVSLICPDPFFYDLDPIEVTMAAYVPNFRFKHRFQAAGEAFGYRQRELIRNIRNVEGTDNSGFTLTISCYGEVTNPSVTNINSGETMKIGTASKPLNLVAGDKVRITTEQGKKRVVLVHDGAETNINNYLSGDSRFIQLHSGDNNIGYSADAGVDSIIINMSYQLRYISA